MGLRRALCLRRHYLVHPRQTVACRGPGISDRPSELLFPAPRRFLILSTKYNLTNKVYYVLIVLVSLTNIVGAAKAALVWSRTDIARGITSHSSHRRGSIQGGALRIALIAGVGDFARTQSD